MPSDQRVGQADPFRHTQWPPSDIHRSRNHNHQLLERAQARFGAKFVLCRDLAARVRAEGGWRKPAPALAPSA